VYNNIEMRSSYKKKNIIYGLVFVAILAALVYLALPGNPPAVRQPQSVSSKPVLAQATASFDKTAYPTDKADSLWAVVNKGRALPASYVPADLVVPDVPLAAVSTAQQMHVRADTAAALEKLIAGAHIAGYELKLVSGYRSYDYQAGVYSGYVRSAGVASADTFSARPGHSEHQTGLAADLGDSGGKCQLDQCFGDLPAGQWLARNAYKYGFIIRYQKDAQNLTGYEYEPWHVRYVGADLAAQLNDTGQTLEQFFGLPIYINYPVQSLML
jgi:zinc D-Ala-D-Ala carboxypeptidase